MYLKNRMTIKKEIKAIVKSETVIDKQVYDYFMDNVDSVKFNDREIVFMIHNILFEYSFDKDDYAIKIADYLLRQTSLRIHGKFSEIYANAFVYNNKVNFELLLRHNACIEQELIEFAEEYLKSVELDIYFHLDSRIDDYRSMLSILKLNTRKQKIENIRSKKRTKIKMINDLIISPLLLNKTY